MKKNHEIKLFEFPDALGPDVFHFKATHPDSDTSGFGTDLTRETALKKAISELTERHAFAHYSASFGTATSNGFACHVTEELAKTSALCELIERDVFFLTWLTKTSPAWLSVTEAFSVNNALVNQFQRFSDAHFKVKLGIIGQASEFKVAVGALLPNNRGLDFGFAIATSCRTSMSEALASVTLDLRRIASMLLLRRKHGDPLFQNLEIEDIKDPYQHTEFYLDPKNGNSCPWLWESSTEVPSLDVPPVSFEAIRPGLSIGNNLYIARALCPELQQYFIGKTTPDKLNISRIRGLFSGDLNWDLHPLG